MYARRLQFAAPALVAVLTMNADAQTVVEGGSKKVTVACGKAGVRVAGLSNEVTLTGMCHEVTVEGKSNTVHIAALGRLTLAGSGNRVYWKAGIDGRAPRIERSGSDNIAERRGGTTELAPATAPSARSGSGVRIVAEKDKAIVSTGTVVVDAEKKGAPATGTTVTRSTAPRPAARATAPAPTGPATPEPAPAVPAPATPVPAPASPAPRSADTLVFADNREERTVDCRGRTVEVLGNRNRLTLKGSCAGLRVSGNRNEVDVESTAIIATTGNENTVRYRDLVDDRPPQVANTGKDNTIRRVTP